MINKFCLGFCVVLCVQISSSVAEEKSATFAGGCFWCMEPPYDKLDGVISTVSGFSGGFTKNPSYQQVTRGGTGHAEVVQVTYDDEKISYQQLLDVYWVNVDPLDPNGQFCDRGSSYRPAIFYHDEAQKQLAMASKKALQDSNRFQSDIAVEVTAFNAFYAAEDYHQDYYLKNPIRYKLYRTGCGRDSVLAKRWGKDSKAFADE